MTQGDPDAGAVEAANAQLYEAVEAGDLDRMGALWVDGPLGETAICVHPGSPTIRGRSAVLRSWALIMANTTYIQFFLTDVDVSAAGDVAVVTCAENILTAADEGAGGGADEGAGTGFAAPGRVVATNVFRRTGEQWRLWVHHASPVIAPREESQT